MKPPTFRLVVAVFTLVLVHVTYSVPQGFDDQEGFTIGSPHQSGLPILEVNKKARPVPVVFDPPDPPELPAPPAVQNPPTASAGVLNAPAAPPAVQNPPAAPAGVLNAPAAPPAPPVVLNTPAAPPAPKGVLNAPAAPPAPSPTVTGAGNEKSAAAALATSQQAAKLLETGPAKLPPIPQPQHPALPINQNSAAALPKPQQPPLGSASAVGHGATQGQPKPQQPPSPAAASAASQPKPQLPNGATTPQQYGAGSVQPPLPPVPPVQPPPLDANAIFLDILANSKCIGHSFGTIHPQFSTFSQGCGNEPKTCRSVCMFVKLGLIEEKGGISLQNFLQFSGKIFTGPIAHLGNEFQGVAKSCHGKHNYPGNVDVHGGCPAYQPVMDCLTDSLRQICKLSIPNKDGRDGKPGKKDSDERQGLGQLFGKFKKDSKEQQGHLYGFQGKGSGRKDSDERTGGHWGHLGQGDGRKDSEERKGRLLGQYGQGSGRKNSEGHQNPPNQGGYQHPQQSNYGSSYQPPTHQPPSPTPPPAYQPPHTPPPAYQPPQNPPSAYQSPQNPPAAYKPPQNPSPAYQPPQNPPPAYQPPQNPPPAHQPPTPSSSYQPPTPAPPHQPPHTPPSAYQAQTPPQQPPLVPPQGYQPPPQFPPSPPNQQPPLQVGYQPPTQAAGYQPPSQGSVYQPKQPLSPGGYGQPPVATGLPAQPPVAGIQAPPAATALPTRPAGPEFDQQSFSSLRLQQPDGMMQPFQPQQQSFNMPSVGMGYTPAASSGIGQGFSNGGPENIFGQAPQGFGFPMTGNNPSVTQGFNMPMQGFNFPGSYGVAKR